MKKHTAFSFDRYVKLEQRMTEFKEKPKCNNPPGCVPFQYGKPKEYKDGLIRRHCPNCSNQIKIEENECEKYGGHVWKSGTSQAGKPYCFCVNCSKRGVPPSATHPPPGEWANASTTVVAPTGVKRPSPPPGAFAGDPTNELMRKVDYLIMQIEIIKQQLVASAQQFK